MKNITSFLLLIFLASCASLQRSLEKENKFYITLGSCFDNDTVSVYVNNSLMFENEVFKSDFSTGIVFNTSITYEDGYLIAQHESEQQKVRAEISDDLIIKLRKNGIKSINTLSLRKGRNMVVDACQSKIEVNQYKKEVTFE